MRHDLELWSPMSGLSSLQRGIDRLFDDYGARTTGLSFNAPCDIEETENEYLLTFDLPGVSKDAIRIEAVDNTLVVAGERRTEKTENRKATHFSERSYGSFQRAFTLPSGVDSERIEADYRDGVLSVLVPKSEKAKARTIRVGEAAAGKPGLFDRFRSKKVEVTDQSGKGAA